MAGRSKKNSTGSTQPEIFYDEIYDQRVNWAKHAIPVRYLDRQLDLYLEGYIWSPKKRTGLTDTVLVLNAFFPIKAQAETLVLVSDIYPTKRTLTSFNPDSSTIKTSKNWHPTDEKHIAAAIDYLEKIERKFTLDELESMINRPLTTADLDLISESKTGLCLYTGLESVVYTRKKLVKTMEKPDLNTLGEVVQHYANCTQCSLGTDRAARGTPVVHGRGHSNAKIFIIAEAPGVQEEQTGMTLYPEAPAGGVLAKVMEAVGLKQEDCYLTNSVLCRPEADPEDKTQNGKPKIEHIVACNSRLKHELFFIKPKIVVLLGRYAYRAFFGVEPPGGVMGNIGWIQSPNYKVYFLNHPSHVVRNLSFSQGNPAETARIKVDYMNHWRQIKEAL